MMVASRYIEDPFDTRHNLAGRCSPAGRKRILKERGAYVEPGSHHENDVGDKDPFSSSY